MKHEDLKQQELIQVENWIRQGEGKAAKKYIESLSPTDIPRELRAGFADVARRVGLYQKSLKILAPIIRPNKPIFPRASAKEKLIFAATLCRVGSFVEAIKLFNEIKSADEPEVDFFMTYPLISNWDYRKTLKPLKRYITNPKISEYRRWVGKVNLAAALVALGESTQAEKLLKTLRIGLLEQKHFLLLGNTFELSSQVAVQQKNFLLARQYLDQAKPHLEAASQDSLFLRKWEVLVPILEAHHSYKKIDISNYSQQILDLRQISQQHQDWETIRDIDFYTGAITENKELLLKVYFGTRSPFYQKIMLKRFSAPINFPSHYVWSQSADPQIVLDITTLTIYRHQTAEPKLMTSQIPIKLGSLLHQLLFSLTLDMYRPTLIGQLFEDLFPNEHFHINSSPTRISQLVLRLNRHLKQANLNIKIKFNNFGYIFLIGPDHGIKKNLNFNPLKSCRDETTLMQLKKQFRHRPFSVQDVVICLGQSIASAKRWLVKQQHKNTIIKISNGPKTSYRMKRSAS